MTFHFINPLWTEFWGNTPYSALAHVWSQPPKETALLQQISTLVSCAVRAMQTSAEPDCPFEDTSLHELWDSHPTGIAVVKKEGVG